MRVILADSDEVDLQLERPVGFIRQSQSDGVDLGKKTQEAVLSEGAQTRRVCALCRGVNASLSHLVQPERVLVVLHPSATREEELGEGDLEKRQQ